MGRSRLASLGLFFLLTSMGCSVLFGLGEFTDGPAGSDDGGGPDVTTEAGDAGDFDGPRCPGTDGLQPGSPWPMLGGCVTHVGRSAFTGPLQTPSPKWVFFLPDAGLASSSAPAIANDGTVYFGNESNGRGLSAVWPDGGLRWATGGNVDGPVSLGIDGTIYAAAGTTLSALKPAGTSLWKFDAAPQVDSCPAVSADGTIAFAAYDGIGWALRPDGGARWSAQLKAIVDSSPALASDGTVYFTTQGGLLVAVRDGTILWTYTSGGLTHSSPAIGSDGTIYFGSRDGLLHAVTPDGQKRWTYATARQVDASPAIAMDGTIYIGSDDAKLHAVNPDGTGRWTFQSNGAIRGFVTIGLDGTLYFGASDKKLYAVASDGSLRFTYQLTDVVSGQAAIDSDGTLFVGTIDARLHALAQ